MCCKQTIIFQWYLCRKKLLMCLSCLIGGNLLTNLGPSKNNYIKLYAMMNLDLHGAAEKLDIECHNGGPEPVNDEHFGELRTIV